MGGAAGRGEEHGDDGDDHRPDERDDVRGPGSCGELCGRRHVVGERDGYADGGGFCALGAVYADADGWRRTAGRALDRPGGQRFGNRRLRRAVSARRWRVDGVARRGEEHGDDGDYHGSDERDDVRGPGSCWELRGGRRVVFERDGDSGVGHADVGGRQGRARRSLQRDKRSELVQQHELEQQRTTRQLVRCADGRKRPRDGIASRGQPVDGFDTALSGQPHESVVVDSRPQPVDRFDTVLVGQPHESGGLVATRQPVDGFDPVLPGEPYEPAEFGARLQRVDGYDPVLSGQPHESGVDGSRQQRVDRFDPVLPGQPREPAEFGAPRQRVDGYDPVLSGQPHESADCVSTTTG